MKRWVLLYVALLSVSFLFWLGAADTARGKLIGYWPMDEGEGTEVRDASGFGNHGTIKGMADWVDGVKGKAISFSKVGGQEARKVAMVDCGNGASLQLPGPMTCMFWISPLAEVQAGSQRWNLIYYNGGPMFKTTPDGTIEAWVKGPGDAETTSAISETDTWLVGQWYHLAVVYERDVALILYVNGEGHDTTAAKGDIHDRTGKFTIGGADWGAWCNAIMDEVKYYDRALSDWEVLREFNLEEAVEPQDKLTSVWSAVKTAER